VQLSNKTILITGGTSGIGFELARQLIEKGNTVIVTGRDPAKLNATSTRLPKVHCVQSDVSDPAAIAKLHAAVLAQFPTLDMLVNNAGIMRNLDLTQRRELNDVTQEIDTNLIGPIRMVQQFLPHLQTRADAAIINVSSGLAFIPMAISPIYSAGKAAMHSYSQSLRAQLEATSITVFELAPPGVETPLLRREFEREMAGTSGMAVDRLVHHAIAGIERGTTEIRPGLSNVLRTMSRVAPNFMFRQMTRMMKPKVIAAAR
jgi:uncharacterized oxidoreductase